VLGLEIGIGFSIVSVPIFVLIVSLCVFCVSDQVHVTGAARVTEMIQIGGRGGGYVDISVWGVVYILIGVL